MKIIWRKFSFVLNTSWFGFVWVIKFFRCVCVCVWKAATQTNQRWNNKRPLQHHHSSIAEYHLQSIAIIIHHQKVVKYIRMHQQTFSWNLQRNYIWSLKQMISKHLKTFPFTSEYSGTVICIPLYSGNYDMNLSTF